MSLKSPVALVALSLSLAVAVSSSGAAHADVPRSVAMSTADDATPVHQVEVHADGVTVDGVYYTRDEFTQLLSEAVPVRVPSTDQPSGQDMVFAFPVAAGAYFIPGVGEVLIAATGAVVVAGVTMAAGTWLYNTITRWFQNSSEAKEVSDARDAIPSA